MCKFGANRTTSTPKSEPSRGDIFAMAKIGIVLKSEKHRTEIRLAKTRGFPGQNTSHP